MSSNAKQLTIRCGFEFGYQAASPTPAILNAQPRLDPWQRMEKEQMIFEPFVSAETFSDPHGNSVKRFVLPPGHTKIRHDVFIAVPPTTDDHWLIDQVVPVSEVPPELLHYTLPSRYCDSDRVMWFALQNFSSFPPGLPRVQAICDWIHKNIEYRYGAGDPTKCASETLAQRYGVCRDFAHLAIALSRCFNVPTRYVTGYVPDVAFQDPGSPMDFHAYMQVYVGHRWYTFDARFNVPRIARINIACGLDAVDGAFSTLFGPASLVAFNVWAYQVDPAEVNLGDPIDMSKRLDGTPQLRYPPRAALPAADVSGPVISLA